ITFNLQQKKDIFIELHNLLIANYFNTDFNKILNELRKINNTKINSILNSIRKKKRTFHYFMAISIIYHDIINISNNYHYITTSQANGDINNNNNNSISNMKFTPYLTLLLIHFKKLQEIADNIKLAKPGELDITDEDMKYNLFSLIERLRECTIFKKLRNSSFAHPFIHTSTGEIIPPQKIVDSIKNGLLQFIKCDESKIKEKLKHFLQKEMNTNILIKNINTYDSFSYASINTYNELIGEIESDTYFHDNPLALIDGFVRYYFSDTIYKISMTYKMNNFILVPVSRQYQLSNRVTCENCVFIYGIYNYLMFLKKKHFNNIEISI
ncbi:TPA: hypothetical protein ON439_003766, partial [Morganella morganii]|nr:hypothetical protein [Morganella morganii]